MRVELKETKKERPRVYPYIGIHPYSGTVVLFIGKKSGVVLVRGTVQEHRVGRSDLTWCEDAFELFEGEVVLSNY